MKRNAFAHYPNPDLDTPLESAEAVQDGTTQAIGHDRDTSIDHADRDAQRARIVATVQAMKEFCP